MTKTRISQLAVLLLTAVFTLAALTARANDSLFDVRSAQPVAGKMANRFGPKAGNFRYDQRMIQAAQIAEMRAHAHSQRLCWHYVKSALVAANVVSVRPASEDAKQAGEELINKYGFKKLAMRDPFAAPLGAVLVYGGRGAGHVEIRSLRGFVSDFESPKPSSRPLIGIYVKPA